MATNLTGSTIASTYDQLLHMDGGPEATEKSVLSGVGVATALKLGTTSASVGNMQVTNNTIASTNTNGNINITPNGTGTVVIPKVDIQAGSITSNNATITGGAISNVTFIGSFSGMTLVESDKFSTKNGSDGVSIEDEDIYAEGTSADIDINITPKGTGEVNVTNIDVISGKVPFETITNKAFGSFYDADTADQTGSLTDRTAVQWATAAVTGQNITVVSNSRLTVALAGTYRINVSLQFNNTDSADRDVTVWFAKNGTAVPSSATVIAVPGSGLGGKLCFATEVFVEAAANDFFEVYWFPVDINTTLHYIAPVVANPGVTPAIPAVPPAIVVIERVE